MLAVLNDTALLAWSLPLLAAILLFAVYFMAKIDGPKDPSDRS